MTWKPMPARAASTRRPPEARYVAIIADIVDSRRITGARRRELQKRLELLLSEVNRDFAQAIAANFLITVGDEFQGLLRGATGMDGPVWHAARAAIDEAKRTDRLGGVFQGFGTTEDLIHNGFARVLHLLRSRMTDKQRRLMDALLGTQTQKEIAQSSGVSKQAVSKQARAA